MYCCACEYCGCTTCNLNCGMLVTTHTTHLKTLLFIRLNNSHKSFARLWTHGHTHAQYISSHLDLLSIMTILKANISQKTYCTDKKTEYVMKSPQWPFDFHVFPFYFTDDFRSLLLILRVSLHLKAKWPKLSGVKVCLVNISFTSTTLLP